jgi:hypothetical protein
MLVFTYLISGLSHVSNTKSFSTSGEMVALIGSLKQRSILMKKKVSGLRFLAEAFI